MVKELAVLIPYRNREEHLNIFVPYFHNYMKNNYPNISFDIFIIEQSDNKPFNRGKLLNIGAIIAKDYKYYLLHDIDMLPVSVMYEYDDNPWHIASNVYEQSNNGELEKNYVSNLANYGGGVLKIPKTVFFDVNGFDNDYWGWGGEDDELKCRLIHHGYNILTILLRNHFVSLKHESNVKDIDTDEGYKKNYKKSEITTNKLDLKTLDTTINGISNIEYELINIEHNQNYIKIIVNL